MKKTLLSKGTRSLHFPMMLLEGEYVSCQDMSLPKKERHVNPQDKLTYSSRKIECEKQWHVMCCMYIHTYTHTAYHKILS